MPVPLPTDRRTCGSAADAKGAGSPPVTLRQGIEVAITRAVPEIDRVVDVTDHASGTNPFYPSTTPSSGGSPRLLPLVRHR